MTTLEGELLLPVRLKKLQESLRKLRDEKKIWLQNGDLGVASAPSNIAVLKYWGKQAGKWQIPAGPSISMTLGSFRSRTEISVQGRFENSKTQEGALPDRFILNDRECGAPSKLLNLLRKLREGWAEDVSFSIKTSNSFPSACGIASSASGYAALVGACADLLQLRKHWSLEDLSYWLLEWSRLGSGSAARSAILGNPIWVRWLPDDNDPNGTLVEQLDGPQLGHAVLLISQDEKEISSTSGHALANTSPFQPIRMGYLARFDRTFQNAIQAGNLRLLGNLTEQDSVLMHAVMATSEPPARYFSEQTSHFLNAFVNWRDRRQLKAFWTLDAGQNPHILFPQQERAEVESFLSQQPWSQFPKMWNEGYKGLSIGLQERDSFG